MVRSRIDKKFWDNSWNSLSFEKYSGVEKYLANTKKLNGLFNRYLIKGNLRILEIGCARAKQLIYFAREFGYRVSGIDLSEKGVGVAKKNLVIAGVEGDILCEDVFNTTLETESFDIVYSMGLVEHFDDVDKIVDAHIKMLKHGGTLIITLPNFRNSLYLSLSKVFGVRDWILKMHNLEPMNKDVWPDILERNGMDILFLDYYGVIDFTLSFGMVNSKVILYPLLLINQAIGYMTYTLPSLEYLSPYLVIIARKK